MIKFRQIFTDGKETVTYYTSKGNFWGWYNKQESFNGFPTRFDEPEGNILYVYNHKKVAERSYPIRFRFVDWEGVSNLKFFEDDDAFWDHFNSLGFDIMPREILSGGNTIYTLNLQSNLFA